MVLRCHVVSRSRRCSSRGVWLFELNGDPTERPLPRAELSPTWRQLIRWQGKESDLEDYLKDLTWPSEQLPPFLYLEVETASSSRVNQLFNDVINTLAQEGLPTPLKGKLDSKRTQQAIQDSDEYDLCDPDALLGLWIYFKTLFVLKVSMQLPNKSNTLQVVVRKSRIARPNIFIFTQLIRLKIGCTNETTLYNLPTSKSYKVLICSI